MPEIVTERDELDHRLGLLSTFLVLAVFYGDRANLG